MKKILSPLAALLLGAGCLVRSVPPWLSAETRVDEPALLGAWHDAQGDAAAFFTGSSQEYQVLVVDDGKDVSRFVATLHRLGDLLLLQVGPTEPDHLNGCALLPGHLLFKAALADGTLELFALDLDSFAARAEKAALPLLPGGSPNDGYVLAGDTPAAEAFVRGQLADPTFFAEKPLYSFRKLPGSAD